MAGLKTNVGVFNVYISSAIAMLCVMPTLYWLTTTGYSCYIHLCLGPFPPSLRDIIF